ncbi:golgin subfamily A member 6-like protein 6 [Branchiostoma lanceolatum]|uniref:golgin subfamily A member 6-like protein 6 n=1 Tax=Branchiostoma lanceolatum TaxID=7740 RepID=UPI0034572F74
MTRMRENDLNRPGTAGNIPGEPDGWGWLLGFIIPAVVPPLVAWVFHSKGEKEKEKMEKEYQHKIGIFHDNQMKMKEENSELHGKLASHYKETEKDQHYILKLEDEKQTLLEVYKKQQEQIHQLEHKGNTIRDNLTKMEKENSKLTEKLMIHHKVRERDYHYISKLEEENQKVRKDHKEQLKKIHQVERESSASRVKLTKVQEETSKLQEMLASHREFKMRDQQYILKLEDDNQTLKKVTKTQQEQIFQLKHKSSTILEKLAKMQEENSQLNEKLANHHDIKEREHQHTLKLEEDNQNVRKDYKEQQEQIYQLEKKSSTILDKLSKMQEENSKLSEKLASHRDLEERDNQYISRLEEENQSLKQDCKEQQEQLAKILDGVETNTSNEPEAPGEAKRATGAEGTSGFTLKESLAYKQKEREIHVKEEYFSKLKQQLQERQDMKCNTWNPMKSSWHRVNLEQQMLGEADINVHARRLRVPAALREIFKYDDFCGPRPEDHGRLMWTFWRQWKMEVEREKNKLLAERLAHDSHK